MALVGSRARNYVEVNESASNRLSGAHAVRSGVLEHEWINVLSVVVLSSRQHRTLYIPTLILADEQAL